jgi:hypothetical protein
MFSSCNIRTNHHGTIQLLDGVAVRSSTRKPASRVGFLHSRIWEPQYLSPPELGCWEVQRHRFKWPVNQFVIKRSTPKRDRSAPRSERLVGLRCFAFPRLCDSQIFSRSSVVRKQTVHEPEPQPVLGGGKHVLNESIANNDPIIHTPIGCHYASLGQKYQDPSLRLSDARYTHQNASKFAPMRQQVQRIVKCRFPFHPNSPLPFERGANPDTKLSTVIARWYLVSTEYILWRLPNRTTAYTTQTYTGQLIWQVCCRVE